MYVKVVFYTAALKIVHRVLTRIHKDERMIESNGALLALNQLVAQTGSCRSLDFLLGVEDILIAIQRYYERGRNN